jgi:hypothetical protein
MYPHLRSLVKTHEGKPFAILGINSDTLEVAQRTVAEEQLTWRNIWAGALGTKGPIPLRWSIQGWPTAFVIDHKGVIRNKDLGGKQLDDVLTKLIADAKADRD